MKELGSSQYSPLWGGLGVWWAIGRGTKSPFVAHQGGTIRLLKLPYRQTLPSA